MSAPTLRTKLRRDLVAKRPQFIAIAVSFLLGIALFVMSYDAFQNLVASYNEMYRRTHFADLTVTGGDLAALADHARAMGAIVAERDVADVPMRIGDHALLGRLVGVPSGRQPAVNGVLVTSGSLPASDSALVEQHAASNFGLSRGDRIEAQGSSGWDVVTVSGVAASPEYLWPARSRQDILTSPDDFAVMFAPEALIARIGAARTQHQLLVYVPDRSSVDAVVSALEAETQKSAATDLVPRAEQPSNAALQEDVQGFDELSFLFPVLFLAAAAMAAWVLLTRLVRSQRAQIGTLRAFGAARRTILVHYLGFGLVAGVVGAAPGAIVGEALARLVTRAYTDAISVPIVVAPLRPATALIGVAFGVLVGAIGAVGPSFAASRVAPAEAMRGLVPSSAGGRSLLEHIAPVRRLSVAARMALRGIGRNRRRSLYTVLGVVLALVLILVSWGMLDTTQVLLARQFDRVQRQDAQVYPTGPVDTSMVARLAAVRGVAAAEPVAELPATVMAGDLSYATRLRAMAPETTMHGFLSPGGDPRSLPTQGILLGVALQQKLDVSIGDEVSVTIPTAAVHLGQRVAGFVAEPLGTFAYVSSPSLGALLQPNVVFLRFAPEADPSVMRQRISSLPEVAAYTDARSLERAADSFMGLFYAFVGLMLLFGGILAFVLVFNAMSVNVAERATEIASLRAEGVSRHRIGRLIGTENLLTVAIGIAPGLVVGYLVARTFMASFSSDLFSFDLAIRPSTYVWCTIAMLAVGLVSLWPALRSVGRIDIATVLRERSG